MLLRQPNSVQTQPSKPLNCYARYSLGKFKACARYHATASWWRVLLVIVFTPATALFASLMPPLGPLRDPNDGLQKNLAGFITHSAATLSMTMVGASFQYRAGAQITHEEHSTSMVVAASFVGMLLLVGLATAVSAVWRFPVPFHWVFFATPWILCFVAAHILVTCGRILSSPTIRCKALRYFPGFFVQISQMIMYPAFSAVFEAANEWQQIALTLFFPFIKSGIKSVLRNLSHELQDFKEEACISSVEICASMYQSMIMQTSPSLYATLVVIGVDVIQGLAAIKLIVEKRSVVPQQEIVQRALLQLQQTPSRINEDALRFYGTKRTSAISVVRSVGRSISFPRRTTIAVAPSNAIAPSIADVQPTSNSHRVKDAVVIVHALEILQAAESMLLIENLEVAIPLVNAIFLSFATQFHSAIYNTKLFVFHFHRERLASALESLTL